MEFRNPIVFPDSNIVSQDDEIGIFFKDDFFKIYFHENAAQMNKTEQIFCKIQMFLQATTKMLYNLLNKFWGKSLYLQTGPAQETSFGDYS